MGEEGGADAHASDFFDASAQDVRTTVGVGASPSVCIERRERECARTRRDGRDVPLRRDDVRGLTTMKCVRSFLTRGI